MEHPECQGMQAIEPSVGELLRLKEFLEGIERLNEAELREMCRQMAHQVLVGYPATMRWLAREAAMNLGNGHRRIGVGETLVEQLIRNGGLKRPPASDDCSG